MTFHPNTEASDTPAELTQAEQEANDAFMSEAFKDGHRAQCERGGTLAAEVCPAVGAVMVDPATSTIMGTSSAGERISIMQHSLLCLQLQLLTEIHQVSPPLVPTTVGSLRAALLRAHQNSARY
jgi:hypothetical protein